MVLNIREKTTPEIQSYKKTMNARGVLAAKCSYRTIMMLIAVRGGMIHYLK